MTEREARSSEEEDGKPGSPTRSLTLRYVFALSAVALFVISAQWMIQHFLNSQKTDSHIINVAGRQRMLSQKITKNVHALAGASNRGQRLEYLGRLDADLALWTRSHDGLIHGDPKLGLAGANSGATKKLYEQMQPHYVMVRDAARQLVKAGADSPDRASSQRLAGIVSKHEGAFLTTMDEIVNTYDRAAKARVSRLRRIELALMIGALLVLLLEAVLVFRPAVRRLHTTIAELVVTKAEYAELARIDGLTGLNNRRRFDCLLAKEYKRAKRESRPISLLIIDVDHFKEYNDTYGHQKGDEALKRIAQTIEEHSRRCADVVARYGGDEFVAILPETGQTGAETVARRMCAAVEALGLVLPHPGVRAVLTVSIGMASMVPQRKEPDKLTELLWAADDGLYRAKRDRRNRVAIGNVATASQ